jgi:putative hydrolase of the HAD superfamily
VIRAVFFDFDGTLYDRDLALRRLAQVQHAMFKDQLDVDEATFVSHLLALDAHGQARPSRFHHRLVEELGLRAELAEKLEATFREHFPRHCIPPKDCVSTLQSLKSSGMKLAIITNGPVSWQMRKIRQCGIEPFFDNILVSEAEGIAKPSPQIFMRALDRCGVTASETIFVGDYRSMTSREHWAQACCRYGSKSRIGLSHLKSGVSKNSAKSCRWFLSPRIDFAVNQLVEPNVYGLSRGPNEKHSLPVRFHGCPVAELRRIHGSFLHGCGHTSRPDQRLRVLENGEGVLRA